MPAFAVLRHLALLSVLAATAPAQADLAVYTDGLDNGFQNFSYGGGSDFANTTPVHTGNRSIAFTGNAFNALSFFHSPGPLASTATPTLRVWIHGGSSGTQQFRLFLQNAGSIVAQASLDAYLPPGGLAPNSWREVRVLLTAPPLSFTGAFDRIDIQSDAAGAQATAYFDDIALLSPVSVGDAIFTNGFEAAVVVAPMFIERGVNVDSMLGDRFSWRDSATQPRSAVLAHNNGQTGPGGSRGGELREFRYQTAAGTRIVRAPPSGAGGFGYVVSHRAEGGNGIPGDDSPLGHGFSGTFERVFEGRHHAIFRFTQLYPRYSRTTAAPPNTRYDVPVTIDWVFSTGRDHPLWALTWDLAAAGVPVNALEDDSRAPYGELLFDGAATSGAHSAIAGVGWGDRYVFASISSPVTYNSAWTWNTPNTIPYVKLWTTAVDATMGTVLTQTIQQQDAGGYFGANRWNTTSAAGNACAAGNDGPSAHAMPCSFNWPYQSINYSMGQVIGGSNANGTNNTRLAWGTNFGFLGQSSYYVHGSAFFGGPLPNATASGWPRKSYSTFVVLGNHSLDPIGAQVEQIETVQGLALTATLGSVVTTGSAGVGRPDTVAYAPAGYDAVYSALRFNAAGGALSANIGVGNGTLREPLLIVGGISVAPSSIQLGGATLIADADYYASLRADTGELWITLARDLSGATNALTIVP